MLKKLYFFYFSTRFGVKTTENFSTIRIRGSVWLSGSCSLHRYFEEVIKDCILY